MAIRGRVWLDDIRLAQPIGLASEDKILNRMNPYIHPPFKGVVTRHTVLYHPSSGRVSITFGQDPSHSDDDITQFMRHGPLQYMASLLSHITSASVHPICFCL